MTTERITATASPADAHPDTFARLTDRPARCAVVVDAALGPGYAANAAAILAMTLGARRPELLGARFGGPGGHTHPGLFPDGLPILRASAAELSELHERALAADPPVGVIALPALGQQTTDYDVFTRWVAAADELALAGVLFAGSARGVRRLTGSLGLLR